MKVRQRRQAWHASLLAIIVAVTGLAGCSTNNGSDGSAGSTLTISNSRVFGSWDTAQLSGSESAVYWEAVYDTLFRQATDGSITPGLATSWSYNANKTVLTVQLREGVKFSDGTPVTPEAVVQNLKRNIAGSCSKTLAVVKDITSQGSTMVITQSAPNPALMTFLSNTCGAIANPKAFSTKELASTPAGSGPYTLDAKRTQTGSTYTFVKNAGYWNAAAYPYNTVVIKSIPDTTARLNALRSGQLNMAELTPVTAGAAKSAGLNLHTTTFRWTGFFILDRAGTKVPALGDVRVRQAIDMAFDRDTIIKNVLNGYAIPTDQAFIEGNELHQDGPLKYSFNVPEAKRLLAEAGYPNGFSITLPAVPREGIQEFEAIVKDSLGSIGITVTYVPESTSTYQDRYLAGAYPMFFMKFESGTAWYDINQSLLPGSNWNGLHSEDPKLSALEQRALNATSDEAAHAAYQEIGAYVRDQAWFAPLWWTQQIIATDKNTNVVLRKGLPNPLIEDYSPAVAR